MLRKVSKGVRIFYKNILLRHASLLSNVFLWKVLSVLLTLLYKINKIGSVYMRELWTERLHIRDFSPEDWKDLHEYLSDKKVLRYEPYDAFTEEESRQEAAKRSKNQDFYAVCLADTNKVIGNLYFSEQNFGTWELGYVFNAAYQGKGYACEAATALLQNAFVKLGARRVVAMCNPENIASWRLLERLGMRREGHLLQNIFFRRDEQGEPIWQDTFEYAILSDEWKRRTVKEEQ